MGGGAPSCAVCARTHAFVCHSRAIVSPMAGVGTLSTTTVAFHNVAGPALKDVLVDVFLPRPGEGTAVIATQCEERGVVWVTVWRADSRQQHRLLVSE